MVSDRCSRYVLLQCSYSQQIPSTLAQSDLNLTMIALLHCIDRGYCSLHQLESNCYHHRYTRLCCNHR
jgi:hypothetical protein